MALASRRADAPTFSPGFAKAFGGARRCTAFFSFFLFFPRSLSRFAEELARSGFALAGTALASRRVDAPTFSPGFAKAFGGARRCTAFFFFLFGKLSFVAWGSFRPVLVAPCTPCGVQFPPGQHHTRASAHGFVMGGTVPPPGQHHRRASAHFAAAFPELSSAILLAAATAGCCWY